MRKQEFEQINKLSMREWAKLPLPKWREFMAYRHKNRPHLKHTFKPLKRTVPDVDNCIAIHNRSGKNSVRAGMRSLLINFWGVGDRKDNRQPDYIEI